MTGRTMIIYKAGARTPKLVMRKNMRRWRDKNERRTTQNEKTAAVVGHRCGDLCRLRR